MRLVASNFNKSENNEMACPSLNYPL